MIPFTPEVMPGKAKIDLAPVPDERALADVSLPEFFPIPRRLTIATGFPGGSDRCSSDTGAAQTGQ